MPDISEKIYTCLLKLAEDPQEPIDTKPLPDLLRTEIEMISQARYFSQQQVDVIVTRAVYEAKLLLLLPPPQMMSLEELERAWRVRGVVLTVWDDPLFQKQIAELLPPVIPSQRKLYEAIVYLNREGRFAQGCHDEIVKRIRSNPTAHATHGVVEMWREEMMQLDPQFAKEVRTISFEYLRSELLRGRIIPDKSEKASLINEALGKRCAELREMPYYKRISEFGNTVIAVKQDMKDWRKGQRRQKRYPKGGFVPLDAKVKKADGSRTSMLEILEAESESLRTQPEEELSSKADPYDALVADIRDKHGDDVAETAKVYFEIYFQPDGPGKKVKQQQVAKAIGKSRKTISRHVEVIEKFLRERMKKN